MIRVQIQGHPPRVQSLLLQSDAHRPVGIPPVPASSARGRALVVVLVHPGLSKMPWPARLLVEGEDVHEDPLRVLYRVEHGPATLPNGVREVQGEAQQRRVLCARHRHVSPIAEEADHDVVEVAVAHRRVERQRQGQVEVAAECPPHLRPGAERRREHDRQQRDIERHAEPFGGETQPLHGATLHEHLVVVYPRQPGRGQVEASRAQGHLIGVRPHRLTVDRCEEAVLQRGEGGAEGQCGRPGSGRLCHPATSQSFDLRVERAEVVDKRHTAKAVGECMRHDEGHIAARLLPGVHKEQRHQKWRRELIPEKVGLLVDVVPRAASHDPHALVEPRLCQRDLRCSRPTALQAPTGTTSRSRHAGRHELPRSRRKFGDPAVGCGPEGRVQRGDVLEKAEELDAHHVAIPEASV
mmetsp:Transcript_686/g.1780  ORF Transcript_686/g.1780 Transcript_686/m.1780 type:complete len:410 (-) Transcript_686:694-1923(-)